MNTLLKIGVTTFLLLIVALAVTLIVTILANQTEPGDGTRPVSMAQAQTPVALENDATYGLDLDKQTVARSKAILDAREGVTR